MDIINFMRTKNGMLEEYDKIKQSELDLIYANGNTMDAVNDRFKELHSRKNRYQDDIDRMTLELILTERALKEIQINWNTINKEE